MFFGFLRRMWREKNINERDLLDFVPKFITQEEADEILGTPQIEE